MPRRANRTISRTSPAWDRWTAAQIGRAADGLIGALRPAAVLQVGGPPALAEALRQREIDARFADRPGAAPGGGRYDLVIQFGDPEDLAGLAAAAERIVFCPVAVRRLVAARTEAPLAAWLTRFGEAGFAPALEVDVSVLAPRALLLRRGPAEARDLSLAAELAALRGRNADLAADAERLTARLDHGEAEAAQSRRGHGGDSHHQAYLHADHARRVAAERLAQIEASTAWRITAPLRRLATATPSTRLMLVGPVKLAWWIVTLQLPRRLRARRAFFAARALAVREGRDPNLAAAQLQAPPTAAPAGAAHAAAPEGQQAVDIVVCVHNALEDVRRCLASILANTLPPYRIVIVDDGSAEPTRDFLAAFAPAHGAVLDRNDKARGYTFAANQGMRLATAPWVVLLNSDTIVTLGWLDRMVAQGADPRVGIVGPMSNIASWQSVPHISDGGDWPQNPLPDDIDIPRMGRLVAEASPGLGVPLSFLNGFCLLIRRTLLDEVGLFDEETFGAGYGEENDFCIRARIAGWKLMVAADVFVFHAQSKSYSTERRLELAKRADAALAAKHDPATHVWPHVGHAQRSLAMAGTRARIGAAIERHRMVRQGRALWRGRRLAVILPLRIAAGGGNVILQELAALRRMGVDSWLVNFGFSAESFERHHPKLDVPVLYVDAPDQIAKLLRDPVFDFDAAIATLYKSVFWMPEARQGFVRAYYIQDYEPLFFEEGDPEKEIAFQSYQDDEDIVMFTKTDWNADQVMNGGGRRPAVVGASVDLDMFRPEPRAHDAAPGPVRICAMVRPATPRRGPERTLEVLRALKAAFGAGVQIDIFGMTEAETAAARLDPAVMTNHGELERAAMAKLLRRSDVFLDLSDYQAMGLTALEAMASGCAVVVPAEGGSNAFARDGQNALVVDTTDTDACYAAAARLVQDGELRQRLRMRAIADVARFTPEAAALRIMETLFAPGEDARAASPHHP